MATPGREWIPLGALRGQVVLITGASRGLGAALAQAFAAEGARLVLCARDEAALQKAADGLAAAGTQVLAVAGDVADPAFAPRLVGAAGKRFGGIDVLINNAGQIGAPSLCFLETYPMDALERVFHINTFAPIRFIQQVVPGMLKRRRGVIINVSSDAAAGAYAGWGAYGASKAALDHLTRTLAVELDGTGIRVYAVDPGDMDTQLHRDCFPGLDPGSPPPPSVATGVFVWLASGEGAAVPTGTRIEAQKWNAIPKARHRQAGAQAGRACHGRKAAPAAPDP